MWTTDRAVARMLSWNKRASGRHPGHPQGAAPSGLVWPGVHVPYSQSPMPPLSQILFLDLNTGVVLWSQALPGLPGDPQSASLPTADHRSAFFFWGLHELVAANQMVRAGRTLRGHICAKSQGLRPKASLRSHLEELLGQLGMRR